MIVALNDVAVVTASPRKSREKCKSWPGNGQEAWQVSSWERWGLCFLVVKCGENTSSIAIRTG